MEESFKKTFTEQWASFILQSYPGKGRLHQACRYALEGVGKRIRPELLFLSAKTIKADVSIEELLPLCFAIEMVHTYSLVHDDLPIFDDDQLRRGRPTVHCAYDSATALLVGDALLTDAWTLLSGGMMTQDLSNAQLAARTQMILNLSKASGSNGMISGQMDDFIWTGKQGYQLDDLVSLHERKTGALISAACTMGALAVGASAQELQRFKIFGSKIGLAFQILDDLIDGLSDTGKTAGKDLDQGKLTFLQVMSEDDCKTYANNSTEEALAKLLPWGEGAEELRRFVVNLLDRKQ